MKNDLICKILRAIFLYVFVLSACWLAWVAVEFSLCGAVDTQKWECWVFTLCAVGARLFVEGAIKER